MEYMNLETIEGTLTVDNINKTAYGNTAAQLKSIVEDNEYIVDLPIHQYFPDGMFRINDVYDEITKQQVIKRIEKYGIKAAGLRWSESTTATPNGSTKYFYKATLPFTIPMTSGKIPNIILPGFTTSSSIPANLNNKECTLVSGKFLFVHDTSIQNTGKVNENMPEYMYYELSEPIITELNPTIFIEFIAGKKLYIYFYLLLIHFFLLLLFFLKQNFHEFYYFLLKIFYQKFLHQELYLHNNVLRYSHLYRSHTSRKLHIRLLPTP